VSDPAAEPPEVVRFDERGLIPAVVQDAVTGDVLMLAFMNEEALQKTRATGRAHYWSRGRNMLWCKGETSGNEQIVEAILINCERNSLLLQVHQTGAVCHDGYPSCYYRSLAPDDSLTVVRDRAFDPAVVYGAPAKPGRDTENAPVSDPLAEATRQQYGAYAFLRDHDLAADSGTSRRLRSSEENFHVRIAEELRELAGVLDGKHRHTDHASDLLLEASQVVYWLLLASLRERITWSRVRPDRALATGDNALSPATSARLLRAEAEIWSLNQSTEPDLAARIHATLGLVGQACHSGGIDPLSVIESDLADLRSRPYLTPYFGAQAP
jgi:phosphoribosyl-AMP cyclohydrolase